MSNIGFREYAHITRPPRELIEKFRGIPVPNIDDHMGRLYAVSREIKPYNNARLLGCAVTVKAPEGDNLMFHRAMDLAREGDIIVVDGRGAERSLCGEVMMRYAISKKLGGFLIDGCIRDTDFLKEVDFPVFASGVSPNGPYKNGPGEINVPVCIGGVAVLPGDILVGDSDGVVVIRPQDAEELALKALNHNKSEEVMFQQITAGCFDHGWVEKSLEAKGCEHL